MSLVAILTLCVHLLARTEASSFATYSDSSCSATDVVQNLAANNAYPAGSCTSLGKATTDSYSGFQFLTLDAGCAITIYQADDTEQPCSGYAVLGSMNTCYNTSWAYYSVDNCDIPVLLSNALTASHTSTQTAPPSSQTSATSSSTSTSSAGSGRINLGGGDVAGIVIGCIAGTAIILYGIWFFMRRRTVSEPNPAPALATQKFQGSTSPTEYSSSYVRTPQASEIHGQGFVAPPAQYSRSDIQMPQTSEVHGQGFAVPPAQYSSSNIQMPQTSEVHGQGFVEAPYGSYYPTVHPGSAELNGQAMPRELPNQRY